MLKKYLQLLQESRKVYPFIMLLFFSLFTFAQQKIPVSGTVFENGTPLSGVSVLIKGTAKGTTTDAQGNFTLQAAKGATLVLSFVGYEYK